MDWQGMVGEVVREVSATAVWTPPEKLYHGTFGWNAAVRLVYEADYTDDIPDEADYTDDMPNDADEDAGS